MNHAALARVAALMAAVHLAPAAQALCLPEPSGCGCGIPCPPGPPIPPPPPPPPAQLSQYIGPAQAVLDSRKSLWFSPDAPDDPAPVASTRVEFLATTPARPPGTQLALSLEASRSWASVRTGIDLSLQLGGNTLRLTGQDAPADTPALAIDSGQTRLLNGTLRANAADVRVGSGHSGASLLLDSGAQLLMEDNLLRSVTVGTGGAGADGLLRVAGGAVLRTDRVFLGSFVAAAAGRLELAGTGSLAELSQLTVGGSARGANGSAVVEGGAVLRTQGLSVASRAGTSGTLTVDGTGSLLALRGGAVHFGTGGNGQVSIRGGAALVGETATVITLGDGQLTHSALMQVQGAGSRMSNVGLQVLPSGTLELRDGARWDTQDDGVNALAVQAGTVRFSGASATLATVTVTALTSVTRDIDNKPVIDLLKSGQWDIGNGSTVAVGSLISIDTGSQMLVHDTGTTLSFTDMVLNGRLSVHNGAEIQGGLIGLGPTGQIGGDRGRIHADVMATDGRITPGNSPGRLEIDGDVVIGGQAVLELEIAGREAGIRHDVLQVSGNLQFNGGRVVLQFLDGFSPGAGDVFQLLQVGGTLTLDPAAVEVQGLQAGWRFDLASDGGHGLQLVSLSQGVSAVPEPATWALWLGGAAALVWRMRRRQV